MLRICGAAVRPEGAAVVLDVSYAAALGNDEGQTVTIKEVPETPTPETPGTTTKTSNPPKTGDTAKAGLWLAIAALSAMGVGGVAIHARKKKKAPLAIEEKKEESEDE